MADTTNFPASPPSTFTPSNSVHGRTLKDYWLSIVLVTCLLVLPFTLGSNKLFSSDKPLGIVVERAIDNRPIKAAFMWLMGVQTSMLYLSYPLSGVLDVTGYGQGALKKLDELDSQGQIAGEGGFAVMAETLHWMQTYAPQLVELFAAGGNHKNTDAAGK